MRSKNTYEAGMISDILQIAQIEQMPNKFNATDVGQEQQVH